MPDVLLFDIDKTLFRSSGVVPAFAQKLEQRYAFPQEAFAKWYEAYRSNLSSSTDFDPSQVLSQVMVVIREAGIDISLEELETLFFDPDTFQSLVYQDVVPALLGLRDQRRLGIFSEGVAEFQQLKLQLTQLRTFFDPNLTYIFQRKLHPANLEILPKNAVVVDDKPDVVKVLSQVGIPAVQVVRTGEEAEELAVRDLTALPGVLKKIRRTFTPELV